MPNAEKLAKKAAYFDKLNKLCVETPSALIVLVDHVGSKQMQDIRLALRGKAEVLMGKNTMIRKGLQIGHSEYPNAGLDKLRAYMKGNLGFIFATNCTVDEIRDVLAENRRWQGAKAGQISNVDLVLPSGPTGMDPSQTSFFQLLSIGTKIVKGQIELTSDFPLLKVGNKVSSSQQALLQKLGLKPFNFGMEVHGVFQDGAVFDAAVLDIKSDVLVTKFMAGIANVAAFGREVGIPSEAGMPQMFANGFKNVAALVSDIDYTFKEVEEVKTFLEDPDAYAAANPVAAVPTGGGGAAAGGGAKVEEKKVVEEEEEEEEMDFDLFG
jgi:large subunit ribosomal protein LP0